MRILQFETVDKGWGGTEIHVIRLTDALLRLGHTVGVVSAPGSLIESECAKLGAQTIPFNLARRGEWRKMPALLRILRRFRPEVVHGHTPVDLGLVSLAARMRNVPVRVCTRHGIPRFSNSRSAKIYSRLFHRFIAVSEFARQYNIDHYGLPANKIVTIYPGLDVSAFPDASATQSANGQKVVLVGRMSGEKGHDMFLRALALAPEVRATFVGDGPLRPELERMAEELDVAERVTWAGSQSDVRPWISETDVLCVPSIRDEAMPWVLLEGMACGKPVVVSTTGGLPEVVTPEFGIVFSNDDAQALADCLSELAGNPERRRTMGCAARREAGECFSLERMGRETANLYQLVQRR